jgi:hypothetical protein
LRSMSCTWRTTIYSIFNVVSSPFSIPKTFLSVFISVTFLLSRRGYGCLSLLNVVCCTGTGPLRRADRSPRGALPTVWVLLNIIRCNNNTLHLQWVGRKGQAKIKVLLLLDPSLILIRSLCLSQYIVLTSCTTTKFNYWSVFIVWCIPGGLDLWFPEPTSS